MSDILIPCGGGGVDLDVVTAAAADIRKGKVIVDKNGDPLTGTMTEKAAATYTPGTANQSIAANQFLTGAQTIKGDTNLKAANIKKGVSIFGVTGTWEGYIPGSNDLYYKGANSGNLKFGTAFTFVSGGSVIFDTAQMTCKSDNSAAFRCCYLYPSASRNLTPYSALKVDFRAGTGKLTADSKLYYGTSLSAVTTGSVGGSLSGNTLSFNISAINATRYIALYLYCSGAGVTFYIDRVYFA